MPECHEIRNIGDHGGKNASGNRVGQHRGARARLQDDEDGDGCKSDGGQPGRDGGSLDAGHAGSDRPVEQDVGCPAQGREQCASDAEVIRGHFRLGDGDDAGRSNSTAYRALPAAARENRDCQRAQELEGHGEPQPDTLHCRVKPEVHGSKHDREEDDRPPLRPREPPNMRPDGRQQNGGRDDLPERDHPGRPQHGKCKRTRRGAELIRYGTAHQGCDSRGPTGPGLRVHHEEIVDPRCHRLTIHFLLY
ncbi:hypothetical protein GCM10027404_21280 [Arthrobacter tumbae]